MRALPCLFDAPLSPWQLAVTPGPPEIVRARTADEFCAPIVQRRALAPPRQFPPRFSTIFMSLQHYYINCLFARPLMSDVCNVVPAEETFAATALPASISPKKKGQSTKVLTHTNGRTCEKTFTCPSIFLRVKSFKAPT